MSDIYDQEMIQIARDTFLKVGIPLVEGHYCYFALPNYESPAEIQVMHGMGAATVGASTLPEQLAAYMAGMRRVIVSSATSPSAGMTSEQIDGEEVLIGGQVCVSNFAKFIPAFIARVKDEIFTLDPRKFQLHKVLDHSAMELKNVRVRLL